MLYKYLFLNLLIFLTFSNVIFAQYNQYGYESDFERKLRLPEEAIKNLNHPNLPILADFLPTDKDSWSISITQSGGFTGVTNIIAAVNSEGRYICQKDDLSIYQKAPKNYFDKLSGFISQTDLSIFKKFSSSQKKENNPITFCRDCRVTTLTYSYRKNKSDVKMYQASSLAFPNVEGEIKKLYENTINAANCQ